ncbi:protein-tyrosine phosphatase-like protein [Mycena albidolilacea]|uniref:Protein-tyrosine phosphatase-like protein n=1 Tax=Mycena albidolilacea TaxID=1033008 RepID=A0AAD7A740_9AGAR|nr:protein-tyrosine phosphatase-like protein [Mycena albidolilacea]
MTSQSLPPPFVIVEGVINARSVGGFSTSDTDSDIVKPVILFRSADPSRITPKGKEQLLALGVRRVFDFRADDEIAGYKTTAPMIPGVEFLRAPVSESRAFDPVSLAARMSEFAGNELETFVTLYHEILEIGGSAFEQVFRHMLDRPSEPCLIHCTAGKDRTGIFTAVLLMLLGVADEDIIKDYALTSVGLEPYLPLLIERFKQQLPDGNVDNWDGALKMASSRPETMAATLNMVREKYGSADKWVTSHTGLNEQDILALRRNFLIKV